MTPFPSLFSDDPFSFPPFPSQPRSPWIGVEYNYVGKQSIPTTGLPPASPTALWAAEQEVHRDENHDRREALGEAFAESGAGVRADHHRHGRVPHLFCAEIQRSQTSRHRPGGRNAARQRHTVTRTHGDGVSRVAAGRDLAANYLDMPHRNATVGTALYSAFPGFCERFAPGSVRWTT